MLINKKGIYIGATLFSAMILTSLSDQTVKADATSTADTGTILTSNSNADDATSSTDSTSTSSSPEVSTSSGSESSGATLNTGTTLSTGSTITSSDTTSTAPTTGATTTPSSNNSSSSSDDDSTAATGTPSSTSSSGTTVSTGTTISTGVTGTSPTDSTSTAATPSTSTSGSTTSNAATSSTSTTGITTSSTTTSVTTASGTTTPSASTSSTTTTGTAASGTTTPSTSTSSTTASGTTAPSTSTSGTTTTGTTASGTTAPSTSTSSTTTTGTSTSGTTVNTNAGAAITTTPSSNATPPNMSGTTTSTTPSPGTTTPTTPTIPSDLYTIPSDVTDDTVVNFTDPILGKMVDYGLNIPNTTPLTVGAIKKFTGSTLNLMLTNFEMRNPTEVGLPASQSTTSMSDQDDVPIESLNGLQYLQFLPSNVTIYLQVMLAYDSNADTNLTPLYNLKFNQLIIDGDYSNSNGKEIDVSQFANIDVTPISYMEMTGITKLSSDSGLNDQGLAEAAPTLIKFANNDQSYHLIELGDSAITDFTPLKGVETGKPVTIVAANNTLSNPTPVYAVTGQPIEFTAPKVLDIDGKDIANTYHFSYSGPQANLVDDNLDNLGNDNYRLVGADPSAKTLIYGHLGWNYSSNADAYIREVNNGTTFETIITNGQPLIWQAHPNVTLNYVDTTGAPITVNGASLTKTIDGENIGDSFDLTADGAVDGYALSNPEALKGNYTQNPQVINLVYTKNQTYDDVPDFPVTPATPPSSTTPPSNPSNDQPKNRIEVKITDVKNISNKTDAALASSGVEATTEINGAKYYLVGYKQWVLAKDFVSEKSGIVRTFNRATEIVHANGKTVTRTLKANAPFKFKGIVTINNKLYYHVATDEYVEVEKSVLFTEMPMSSIKTMKKASLYNSQGDILTEELPSGTVWKTDGYAIINGVKMYRVATDEWVDEAQLDLS
ncbi:hypothetical protein FHL06_05815 [Lactobacillus halodurans]|uniref:S-layer protein C-terminal domain-containing protein n=1 Tax=Companilactobacillus halodurans TaxID=2584183 RepID=A0A5P0ZPW4_9LACO|nr:SLAP domain-containing protein [Companilactobacillus halodurans]MQS75901.1 hypothetical protein [Companilactobacillus halodurans]